MKNLGFIGTGAMGNLMAHRLLTSGHQELFIYDRNADKMTTLKQAGARTCASAGEVARNTEIIFLMVLTASDVEAVLFGPNGAFNSLQSGNIVVCMSSISATKVKNIHSRLKKNNVGFLDAPVSGGKSGAKEGSLAIMVGGDKEDFNVVMPYFEVMGHNINLIGAHGSGQTAKAANQIIVSVTRAAVGEALLFAQREGADPEQVRQALMGGLAHSAILETYGARISKLPNLIEFDSPILKKDINNIVTTAAELGLELPFSRLTQEMYNQVDSNND